MTNLDIIKSQKDKIESLNKEIQTLKKEVNVILQISEIVLTQNITLQRALHTKGAPISEYPKLGMSPNTAMVILFTKEQTGTVILKESSVYQVGEWSTGWSYPEYWKDYNEEVVLQNPL